MRILNGKFVNFGSYDHLDFDFSSLGLALVFGKTGSGKSTIPDMVSWTLYGQTAKDGNVDEVRSWTNLNEPTIGSISIDTGTGKIVVVRTRGRATENDLYWAEGHIDNTAIRGKDLNDTQRLLAGRLGIDSDLYFLGTYFHEFSSTGLFFTAKAKDRRAVFEKIANLELASRLGSVAADTRASSRKSLDILLANSNRLQGRRESIHKGYEDSIRRRNEFNDATNERIREYELKSSSFEKIKDEKIEALNLKIHLWEEKLENQILNKKLEARSLEKRTVPREQLEQEIRTLKEEPPCKTCGQSIAADTINKRVEQQVINQLLLQKLDFAKLLLRNLEEEENPWYAHIEPTINEENTYALHIEEEKKKINPFKAQVEKLEKELSGITGELALLQSEIDTLEAKISNLTRLYDLSFELRGELVKQSVQNVQNSTNRYLEKYFDSEIRVGFALEGSDDLTVSIQKSGYDCSYKQLSRGQRALLRMTFVVSIMKAAANNAAVHFDNLFFDEILDGMDGDLKIKAFAMLEELSTEHESILVIDHDQGFQNLFSKQFHVTMESDNSHIEEQHE